METTDELQEFVQAVGVDNVRGRLLARGEARAIIRRAGQVPEDAPPLGETLDSDLAEYGFSLLRACLALREHEGESEVWRSGFLRAGNAFESLVRNGSPEAPARGFFRTMGAASHHLAGYSAMAFSLIKQQEQDPNFAPSELAIARLLLRDLRGLRDDALKWLRDPTNQDSAIRIRLTEGDLDIDDALSIVLTTTVYRAFAFFEFGLATGESTLYESAIALLDLALRVAHNAGAVTLWWIIRVARNLIDDLWKSSLHQLLPTNGPANADNYAKNRECFLAALYTRRSSEVELWPSQIDAARRAIDPADDLVVALPTSAGKTRIAELCTLVSLSVGSRVLIITPLRALSAQTERSFRRTFGPLGFSVSSLYGASGMVPGDEDALRAKDIVIATPEKLDFALRNDPSLIDDVGLIILDEGHLIGPSERELRYEILVQRLLRRADAEARRIVCLSAILPDGEQLNDLTAWIRSDVDGNAVKSKWRPTRQRYGTLSWTGHAARLKFDFDAEGPFIQRFVEEQAPIPPRRTPFPKDNSELTLAAAWKFADEGKRTLIFCTQRDHVEGYAQKIVDLAHRGFLASLLSNPRAIERAKIIGAEWLGGNHPAVACLEVGVAIHHARLPSPFLREVERLLNEGVLTVTVASPTLAQGLNLNAAVLLVPNLYRSGIPLTGEEFANVAGRAGRAFVDLEGLIVHVMHEPKRWRRQAWRNLVQSAKARSLESGLIQIVSEILDRLARTHVFERDNAFEYLANNRAAWHVDVNEEDGESFDRLLEKLDTTILGLIEALDADAEDLPNLIDEALNGSLWARQIARQADDIRARQKDLFCARSRLIWSTTDDQQRRGHFAMGVGLETGLALDTLAEELGELLDKANNAALSGEVETLQHSLGQLAEHLLHIRPFAPDDPLPPNWKSIMSSWVAGEPIQDIGPDNMRFIEDAFAYRLVWALEAIRVQRIAVGWESDIISGSAAACLETGLPKFMMAMLVRAGFPSRLAAMTIVRTLNPVFVDVAGLREWLESDEISSLTRKNDWPTPATALIWQQFRKEFLTTNNQKWTTNEWKRNVDQASQEIEPEIDQFYRVEVDDHDQSVWICTPDFQRIVKLRRRMIDRFPSVMTARFEEGSAQCVLRRLGRSRPTWLD